MAKSIIQEDKAHCFLCGRNASAEYFGLDCHHVFFGPNRKASDKYGLTVYLCHDRYHCDPYFLVSKDFVDRIATKMKGGAE
jgi:hypothetical protein